MGACTKCGMRGYLERGRQNTLPEEERIPLFMCAKLCQSFELSDFWSHVYTRCWRYKWSGGIWRFGWASIGKYLNTDGLGYLQLLTLPVQIIHRWPTYAWLRSQCLQSFCWECSSGCVSLPESIISFGCTGTTGSDIGEACLVWRVQSGCLSAVIHRRSSIAIGNSVVV